MYASSSGRGRGTNDGSPSVAALAGRFRGALDQRSASTEPPWMDPKEITALIEKNLAGAKRAGAKRTGRAITRRPSICAAFAGKRSLQRHQLVYATLGSRVGNEIHALALKTFTPEEWRPEGRVAQ